MKHSIVLALLVLLVSVSLAAGASVPPGLFSTIGYTTNLVASDQFLFPVPSEIEFLPSGYAKFHIQAGGGPAVDNNALCETLYGVSCEALCSLVGGACGVSGSFEGSFSFDEWGVVGPVTFDDSGNIDPESLASGANSGLLTITTSGGMANARFGGQANDETVSGSFQFLGGTGAYRRLQGIGTYAGNAGYVFAVNYIPCGQPGQPPCPATLCGAYGEDLKLLRPKAMWTLGNYGNQTVHLDRLLLHWPEQNGALTGVRLGGKLLAAGSLGGPPINGYYWVDLDLSNAPARDREIRGGKSSKLMLDFENMGIGQAPAGYTFLARFEQGCSAIHVAFP